MPDSIYLAGPAADAVALVRMPRQPRPVLEHFRCGAPGRAERETFIVAAFLERYDAHIDHFSDTLVGYRDAAGAWAAATRIVQKGNTQGAVLLDAIPPVPEPPRFLTLALASSLLMAWSGARTLPMRRP